MPVKRRERLGNEITGLSSVKQQPGIINKLIKQTNSGTNSNNNSININDNNNLILKQQQLDRNSYLGALTKSQLKIECRKRGSKTTGNKTNLVRFCVCLEIIFHVFCFFFPSIYVVLNCFFFLKYLFE